MASKDPSGTRQASLILAPYSEHRHKDPACTPSTSVLVAMTGIAHQSQHYPWSPAISSQSSHHNFKEPPFISQNLRERWALFSIPTLEGRNKQTKTRKQKHTGIARRNGESLGIKGTVGEHRSRQSALVGGLQTLNLECRCQTDTSLSVPQTQPFSQPATSKRPAFS